MKILALLSMMVLSFSINSNEIFPHCKDTVTEIALNNNTNLGFSAEDLLKAASGERHLNWYWGYKKGKTPLEAKIASVVNVARYVQRVPVNSHGKICSDSIELDALLIFSTDDGTFNEIVPITLFSTTDGKKAAFITQKEFDPKSFYEELTLPADVQAIFGIGGEFSTERAAFTLYGRYPNINEGNSGYTIFPVGFAY